MHVFATLSALSHSCPVLQLQWVKVDFDKWAEEDDEEEEVQEPDLGGMQNFNMEEVRLVNLLNGTAVHFAP